MVTGTAWKYLVWGKRLQEFSATGLNSFLDRSHVNAWKEMYMMYGPIRTDTGLSSSRSHVNTPLVLIPSAIRNRRFQRRMTHLSFNGALFFWIILAWAAGGCRVEQVLPPPVQLWLVIKISITKKFFQLESRANHEFLKYTIAEIK